jgi:hypothetical protein
MGADRHRSHAVIHHDGVQSQRLAQLTCQVHAGPRGCPGGRIGPAEHDAGRRVDDAAHANPKRSHLFSFDPGFPAHRPHQFHDLAEDHVPVGRHR